MKYLAAIPMTLAVAAPAAAAPMASDWDWQLSEPLKLRPGVQVYDLDPESVTPAQIAALKARGTYTICYVSVGTLEKDCPDFAAFPAAVVGKVYDDWPDEKFLDIRALDTLLPLMKARFARCKALGFDAIEPDNIDGYENDSGFALSRADQLTYIVRLAAVAHGMGLEIGQKNVPELTADLLPKLDFVIAESCWQDHWCQQVRPYVKAGKPVFDAEYTDRPIRFEKACQAAENMGIAMILKDRDLSADRRACP